MTSDDTATSPRTSGNRVSTRLRILLHDYSGHPFQIQLSRALAQRGHQVHHLYSSAFQTPKGNLGKRSDDPDSLAIFPLALDEPFEKHRFIRRRGQEIAFGRRVAHEIARFRPDIVVSANAPLDAQSHILSATHAAGARFVFWQQDIYSDAIARILPRKLPVLGHLIGAHYTRLERALLRASDHVVVISDDFLPFVTSAGIAPDAVSVIPNWAPLDDLTPLPRDNPWAARQMAPGLRAVYSGTLGLKHDPGVLAAIARALPGTLHVHAEGPTADALAQMSAREGIDNLVVRPWVDFADLPALLGGANILLAMIGEDAGAFSVPSKILSCLAMGRPILASMPGTNLASRILRDANAGLVSEPGDSDGLLANLKRLVDSPALRIAMGANGRRYAERTFDISTITQEFEAIFLHTLA